MTDTHGLVPLKRHEFVMAALSVDKFIYFVFYNRKNLYYILYIYIYIYTKTVRRGGLTRRLDETVTRLVSYAGQRNIQNIQNI